MVYITNDYENIKFYNKNNHNLETIRVCFSQQFLLNVYFMYYIFAFKHFFFYYFFVFIFVSFALWKSDAYLSCEIN